MTAKQRKILVPVDGSDGSAKAAAFAADLARDCGAEVVLLYVYDAPAAVAMGLLAVVPNSLDDLPAKVAQAAFAKARTAMGDVQIREHLVEMGHPVQSILEVAEKGGFSQIVMGARGLSAFKKLLLGSVSERVLHGARCSVTIVH